MFRPEGKFRKKRLSWGIRGEKRRMNWGMGFARKNTSWRDCVIMKESGRLSLKMGQALQESKRITIQPTLLWGCLQTK